MESSGDNYRHLRYWAELPGEVAYQSLKALGNGILQMYGAWTQQNIEISPIEQPKPEEK
jgi:hypothetical protein